MLTGEIDFHLPTHSTDAISTVACCLYATSVYRYQAASKYTGIPVMGWDCYTSVKFFIRDIFDLAKSHVLIMESQPNLTDVSASKLRRYLHIDADGAETAIFQVNYTNK